MAKTCHCGMKISEEKEFCFQHDPAISAEDKRAAKAKGGYHSRIIPHGLKSSTVLPIDSVTDLKNFLNVLLAKGIDKIEDTPKMLKATLPIVDKFNTVFELELLEAMQQKLKIIEAKQNGDLLEAGSYETINQTNSSED